MSVRVTQLLKSLQTGDKTVLDELFPLVYSELKQLAAAQLRNEREDHTLQPTALVHEAYLRLIEQHSVDWQNKAHFFSIASEMMRRILVNHAINHQAKKRGRGETKIALDEAVSFASERDINLIDLDTALLKLAGLDERQARIVEMKFFGGLSTEEVAAVLEISGRTVKREWRSAKIWLYEEMKSA
ncbi:MAG TPA: sigma-70 family RNA polymerase sigma factor [Pyrinomonadaceae bacterium]|nr:sigma-70 family RNA polymerase sigma factor [Pyrinomonadaceae bacterium]